MEYYLPVQNDPPQPKESRLKLWVSGLVVNCINIVFHIGMLAVFEPLFFFLYATDFERSVYLQNLGNYINEVIKQINIIPTSSFDAIRQVLFGTDNIPELQKKMEDMHVSAMEAAAERASSNHHLIMYSAFLAGGIFAFAIILVIVANCNSFRISWRKIAADNLFMLILLGAYEYAFFRLVVTKFQVQYPEETDYFVMNKIVQNTQILN